MVAVGASPEIDGGVLHVAAGGKSPRTPPTKKAFLCAYEMSALSLSDQFQECTLKVYMMQP